MRSAVVSALLLLAVLLPPKLWRAGLGETVWLDETYSLVLTTHPAPEIVRLAAQGDAHPPLYYLALRAWLGLGRAAGSEPGILWVRGLGILAWAVAAVAALVVGRRLLGAGPGTLFGWAVAAGAAAATLALDARSYGFAFAGTVVAYLALLRLSVAPEDELRAEGSRAVRWWVIYALAAAITLWSHLLAGLLVALLALAWLGPALRDGRTRRSLLGWTVSNFSVVLLFLPWLVRVRHQWALLQQAEPTWMTPPSLAHLGFSFVYWLPFGRLGWPTVPPFRYGLAVGVATILLPLGAAALGAGFRRRRGRPGGPAAGRSREVLGVAARSAWLGLVPSVLFVFLIWSIDRLELAHVFHAPRYPLLAAGPWAGGLAALALLGAPGRPGLPSGPRWRTGLAAALLAPWLAAGLVCQVWAGFVHSRPGLASLVEDRGVRTAYVVPSELLPFFRDHLAGIDARPLERLPCDVLEGRAAEPVAVLDVNPWTRIEGPRERLFRRLADGRLLASGVRRTLLDESRTRATLYELTGLEEPWFRSLCRHGFRRAPAPVPAQAAARALPEAQRRSDGWGDVELGADLRPFRWGTRRTVRIRFEGGLAPGRYVLHLRGRRQPYPAREALFRGRVVGSAGSGAGDGTADEGGGFARTVPSGAFALEEPVTLAAPLEDPVVLVEHPTWSPARELGSDDRRRLTFQLLGAWFERMR